MRKYIDGTKVIDGVEVNCGNPNLFPVLKGFGDVLGKELMAELLHECLGEESMFYPNYEEIGLGESKGWASLAQQLELINYISMKISINSGYNYKNWCGKYEHLVVED